ncbi:MAG: hypothetical protein AAGH87_06250 [Pseudomonadota bacterium]
MLHVLKTVFYFGPLIFGLGFMAPLISQSLTAFGFEASFGLSNLAIGLLGGGLLGLCAQIRGRWI